jgi:hypothetical protein
MNSLQLQAASLSLRGKSGSFGSIGQSPLSPNQPPQPPQVMHVCVRVCLCVFVCVCACLCVLCVCIYVRTYVLTYILRPNLSAPMYIRIYIYIGICPAAAVTRVWPAAAIDASPDRARLVSLVCFVIPYVSLSLLLCVSLCVLLFVSRRAAPVVCSSARQSEYS